MAKPSTSENNYKRSDKVVKALKDKYGLTYSPSRRNTSRKSRVQDQDFRCDIWLQVMDEFCRRLACAELT